MAEPRPTPPQAHPILKLASEYGSACMDFAREKYGTPAYDKAYAHCSAAWEAMARALGVAIPQTEQEKNHG